MRLYETLGVREDATLAQIKTAYRKKAKQHHPDKGGDVEAFKKVQQAYEVLGNPERRKHYDETGDLGSNVDNGDRELWAELAQLVAQTLDQCDDVETLDLFGKVKARINNSINHGRTALQANEKLIKVRTKAIERLSRAGGEDIIAMGLQSQIGQVEQHSHDVEKQITKLNRMLELVKEYQYLHDEESSGTSSWYGGTTSSTIFFR